MTKAPFRILLGPTASGKESAALQIADKISSDIISVDSMKIYRGMDIGTATPSVDVLGRKKHWAINIVDPSESFSVAQYNEYVEGVVEQLESEGKEFIFSGGTALYHKILTEGMFDGPGEDSFLREELKMEAEKYGVEHVHDKLKRIDPMAADKIHPNDIKRVIRAIEVVTLTGIPISSQQVQFGKRRTDRNISMVGILWDRDKLYARINHRVDLMFEKGLLEEVEALFRSGIILSKQASVAVGYAELFSYFNGDISFDEAKELICRNSRHLAKSQMTWFRKFDCHWIEVDESTSLAEVAEKTLAFWNSDLS